MSSKYSPTLHTSNKQANIFSALISPLAFDIILDRPLMDCLVHIQTTNEQMVPWRKYRLSLTRTNEGSATFSLLKERRIIPILAHGQVEVFNDVSTRLTGQVRANYWRLASILGFGVSILTGILLTQQTTANWSFATLAFFILIVGASIELIGQHYAKLSIYTFLRRL